jgi:[FeFe] hydrogenase H-cluster maturation GTPase HydF
MQTTPLSNRLHIGIFGRTNVGKSSLLNSIIGQNLSITSSLPGTTTDPVYKTMELIPFGPVVFIDTAGYDDTGMLGELRMEKTNDIIRKTDLAVLVIGEDGWNEQEEQVSSRLASLDIPVLTVINKTDQLSKEKLEEIRTSIPSERVYEISCTTNKGLEILKQAIMENAPKKYEQPTIVGDLISRGDLVILVTPLDLEAPKGRLILPQVQTLRDILDHEAVGIMLKQTELAETLKNLPEPKLVITDSQIFEFVSNTIPPHIPLTSFSILFARFKGDLKTLVQGAHILDELSRDDKILIAEACTHHIGNDDIARVKLPHLIQEYIGSGLNIDFACGQDFPPNLKDYKLIIHCGACMLNRSGFVNRIAEAKEQQVPITNFGVTIAKMVGILPRATEIF